MQDIPNKKHKPKGSKPTSPTASLSSNMLVGAQPKLATNDSPAQRSQRVYEFFRRKSEAEALVKVQVDLDDIMPEPSGPHVSLQRSLSGKLSAAAIHGSASGSHGRVSSGT